MKISPEEAAARMAEGFTYVDVRSEPEFGEGRPRGSINVPLSILTETGLAQDPDFLANVRERFPDLDTPLIVGCQAGGRSGRAARLLMDAGYTRILDQRAGWDGSRGTFGEVTEPGWRRLDLPVDP